MLTYIRWGRLLFVSFLTIYVFSVICNVISYRQIQYGMSDPLPDISSDAKHILPGINLINAIDIITGSTAAISLIFWLCTRHTKPLVRFVAIQMVILPVLALSQWTTVMPDALPNCIAVLNIPRGKDMSWVWYTLFPRPCGDIFWASDIGQLVFWASLGVRCIPYRVVKFLYACVIITCVGLSLGARYQYTSGIMYTLLISFGAATHPLFASLGEYMFTYRVSDRRNSEEVLALI